MFIHSEVYVRYAPMRVFISSTSICVCTAYKLQLEYCRADSRLNDYFNVLPLDSFENDDTLKNEKIHT